MSNRERVPRFPNDPMKELLELAPYRNCQAHFDRMQKRPSVQKVLAFERETQEAFAKAA